MCVEGQGSLTSADPARRIVIAGAGIGGLTAALALARHNFYVTVLEKSAKLETAGAGIQLSPNASRFLIALGLGNALAASAVTPDEISVMTAFSGREVVGIPLGPAIASRYGAPYWIIHRADLQAALLARVAKNDAIELKLGTAFVDAQGEAHGVAVSGETNGIHSISRAAALIGADGIHSVVRKRFHKGHTTTFSGKVAWRSLIDADAKTTAAIGNRIMLWLAPDAHIVMYPVTGGKQINVVAIASGSAAMTDTSQSKLPDAFRPAQLPAALRTIIDQANVWTPWPLHSVNAPLWTEGYVALLGDAAHAMMPFAAQGAAMAIEDAAVLASALSGQPDDIPAALKRYASQRHPRLARIKRTAAQTGAIYHMRGPMALARDMSMKMLGGGRLLSRQHWIYDWIA